MEDENIIMFRNASGLLDHSQAVKDVLKNDEELRQEWKKAKIKQIKLKLEPNNEIQKYCLQFEISRLIEKTMKKVAQNNEKIKQIRNSNPYINLDLSQEHKSGTQITMLQDKLFEKILDIPNDYVRKKSSSQEFQVQNKTDSDSLMEDFQAYNIKQSDPYTEVDSKQFFQTTIFTGISKLTSPQPPSTNKVSTKSKNVLKKHVDPKTSKYGQSKERKKSGSATHSSRVQYQAAFLSSVSQKLSKPQTYGPKQKQQLIKPKPKLQASRSNDQNRNKNQKKLIELQSHKKKDHLQEYVSPTYHEDDIINIQNLDASKISVKQQSELSLEMEQILGNKNTFTQKIVPKQKNSKPPQSKPIKNKQKYLSPRYDQIPSLKTNMITLFQQDQKERSLKRSKVAQQPKSSFIKSKMGAHNSFISPPGNQIIQDTVNQFNSQRSQQNISNFNKKRAEFMALTSKRKDSINNAYSDHISNRKKSNSSQNSSQKRFIRLKPENQSASGGALPKSPSPLVGQISQSNVQSKYQNPFLKNVQTQPQSKLETLQISIQNSEQVPSHQKIIPQNKAAPIQSSFPDKHDQKNNQDTQSHKALWNPYIKPKISQKAQNKGRTGSFLQQQKAKQVLNHSAQKKSNEQNIIESIKNNFGKNQASQKPLMYSKPSNAVKPPNALMPQLSSKPQDIFSTVQFGTHSQIHVSQLQTPVHGSMMSPTNQRSNSNPRAATTSNIQLQRKQVSRDLRTKSKNLQAPGDHETLSGQSRSVSRGASLSSMVKRRLKSIVPPGGGMIPKSEEYLQRVFQNEFWPIARSILRNEADEELVKMLENHALKVCEDKRNAEAFLWSENNLQATIQEDEAQAQARLQFQHKCLDLYIGMKSYEGLMEKLGFIKKDFMDGRIEFMQFWNMLMNIQKKLDLKILKKITSDSLNASHRQRSVSSYKLERDSSDENFGGGVNKEQLNRYFVPLDDSDLLENESDKERKWDVIQDEEENKSEDETWQLAKQQPKKPQIQIKILLDGLQNLLGISKTQPQVKNSKEKFKALIDNRTKFEEARRQAQQQERQKKKHEDIIQRTKEIQQEKMIRKEHRQMAGSIGGYFASPNKLKYVDGHSKKKIQNKDSFIQTKHQKPLSYNSRIQQMNYFAQHLRSQKEPKQKKQADESSATRKKSQSSTQDLSSKIEQQKNLYDSRMSKRSNPVIKIKELPTISKSLKKSRESHLRSQNQNDLVMKSNEFLDAQKATQEVLKTIEKVSDGIDIDLDDLEDITNDPQLMQGTEDTNQVLVTRLKKLKIQTPPENVIDINQKPSNPHRGSTFGKHDPLSYQGSENLFQIRKESIEEFQVPKIETEADIEVQNPVELEIVEPINPSALVTPQNQENATKENEEQKYNQEIVDQEASFSIDGTPDKKKLQQEIFQMPVFKSKIQEEAKQLEEIAELRSRIDKLQNNPRDFESAGVIKESVREDSVGSSEDEIAKVLRTSTLTLTQRSNGSFHKNPSESEIKKIQEEARLMIEKEKSKESLVQKQTSLVESKYTEIEIPGLFNESNNTSKQMDESKIAINIEEAKTIESPLPDESALDPKVSTPAPLNFQNQFSQPQPDQRQATQFEQADPSPMQSRRRAQKQHQPKQNKGIFQSQNQALINIHDQIDQQQIDTLVEQSRQTQFHENENSSPENEQNMTFQNENEAPVSTEPNKNSPKVIKVERELNPKDLQAKQKDITDMKQVFYPEKQEQSSLINLDGNSDGMAFEEEKEELEFDKPIPQKSKKFNTASRKSHETKQLTRGSNDSTKSLRSHQNTSLITGSEAQTFKSPQQMARNSNDSSSDQVKKFLSRHHQKQTKNYRINLDSSQGRQSSGEQSTIYQFQSQGGKSPSVDRSSVGGSTFLKSKYAIPKTTIQFDIHVDQVVGTQSIEITDKRHISDAIQRFALKWNITDEGKMKKLKKYIKSQLKEEKIRQMGESQSQSGFQ